MLAVQLNTAFWHAGSAELCQVQQCTQRMYQKQITISQVGESFRCSQRAEEALTLPNIVLLL